MAVLMLPRLEKLSFNLKFAFGIGQLAEGLKAGALGTFLFFYYNQVLGLSGTLTGLAVSTALVVDAVVDPLIGSLSDHWRSKYGRRHPFMYASILPLAICFFLLFAPPVRGEWALFVWLVVFTNLARISISLYFVPHQALGAEMSTDFTERSALVAYRVFFSIVGGFAATVIGFQFFFAPTPEFSNGQLNGVAYAPFAATLAALMAIAIFWSTLGTRSVIPYLPKAAPEAPVNAFAFLVRVLKDMATALRCGSFAWLFSGVLVIFVMIGVNTALDLYMYTYFWELTHGQIVALATAYPVGLMLGALVAPSLQRRYGKRWALLFGTITWGALQVLPIMLRLAGWFPENGDGMLVPILIVMRVLQGAGAVQANVAFGSAVADVCDEHELQSGKRQEGIFFSAVSFSSTCAVGGGSLIAGLGLDLIDWPRGAKILSAADVPADAIFGLGVIYGPVVASLALLTMWCYSHYRLTRERHAEILAELARRRDVLAAADR